MSRRGRSDSLWERLRDAIAPEVPLAAQAPTLDPLTYTVIRGAVLLATEHNHGVVASWHVFAALLAIDEVADALRARGCYDLVRALVFERVETADIPPLSRSGVPSEGDIAQLIRRAFSYAYGLESATAKPIHLFGALIMQPEIIEALTACDIDPAPLALWPRYGAKVPQSSPDLRAEEEVVLVMHNDDLTTQPFVEDAVQRMLGLTPDEATALMLIVHESGEAPLGIMSVDEARLHAEAIMENARLHGFPLLCTLRRLRPR